MCAVCLRYLPIDTNHQLFFITVFLAVLLFLSICIILQWRSPSRFTDDNNSALFLWFEIEVWLRKPWMHAGPVLNLTYDFILFLFPIRKWRVWPKDVSLHHLWSLSKHLTDLDQSQGESVSFAGCTVLHFLSPKLEMFLSYCPHLVVNHNSGCSVAAQL